MVTTLVGVMPEWLRQPLTPYEIAELTYRIEREDLQDRRRAAGPVRRGLRRLQLHRVPRDHTVVNPLRIRREVVNELEYSTAALLHRSDAHLGRTSSRTRCAPTCRGRTRSSVASIG